MPSTTTHGLPVPVSTDPPAGHTQMTTLAASIDAQLLSTVTSLPGSPVDGQRCLYLADATNGVVWDLRYRSASASTFKWEFVGGSALSSEVLTSQSTNSNTYVDLTTVGPSITAPLAGDYMITFSATIVSGVDHDGFVAVKFGATAASDNDAIEESVITGSTPASAVAASRQMRRNVSAASQVVKLVYRSGNANFPNFSRRNLNLIPIRVG